MDLLSDPVDQSLSLASESPSKEEEDAEWEREKQAEIEAANQLRRQILANPMIRNLINNLRRLDDKYEQTINELEDIRVDFYKFSEEERERNPVARGLYRRWYDKDYERKLTGISLLHAKEDLHNVMHGSVFFWPRDLMRHSFSARAIG